MSQRILSLIVATTLLVVSSLAQEAKSPRFTKDFKDKMTLPAQKAVAIRGTGEPGETVLVTFASQAKSGKVNKKGRWRVRLDPIDPGGQYELTVYGGENKAPSHTIMLIEVKAPPPPPPPVYPDPDEIIPFKNTAKGDLTLHVFKPKGWRKTDRRPAAVFFFGGGWVGGTPRQFYPHARHVADRGMVGISAQYRTRTSHGTDPTKCIEDGKSAIRWVREHAAELGIDPARIATGGGSAGGHVAASTGLLPKHDNPDENAAISSRPNAMMLFNPVIDCSPKGFGGTKAFGDAWKDASPLHNVTDSNPPTIVFHGELDTTVPFSAVEAFTKAMHANRSRCDLHGYAGEKHAFFNIGKRSFGDTIRLMDGFLVSLGFLGDEKLAAAQSTKPNIVLIMADDLGYGDISCYGSTEIQTPNLDALAAGGMRFLDYHSNGAVCSPTRAALLTGRYQQRTGISGVVTAKGHRHTGLDLNETTFAEVLKSAGYGTSIFGKWHVGYQPKFNPVHQGFDQFVGYVSGNVDFHSHIDQVGEEDWWKQDKLVPEKGYVTDLITEHGLRFIDAHKDKPFCLYLAHEAPHYPYQGRGDKADRTLGKGTPTHGSRKDKKGAYKEMVEVMDEGIGRIVARLKEHGLEKNTLVFFCSDNGATKLGDSGGLRGHKGSLWEGGHRVPAIAYWPGTIPAGSTTEATVLGMDLLPTMAALAGADAPESIDGVDLTSLLKKNVALPARELFWGARGGIAMRDGQWKLVLPPKGEASLFDLSTDKAEAKDLAKEEAERFDAMKAKAKAWLKSVTDGVEPRT